MGVSVPVLFELIRNKHGHQFTGGDNALTLVRHMVIGMPRQEKRK